MITATRAAVIAIMILIVPARADDRIAVSLAHTQPQNAGIDPAAVVASVFKREVEAATAGRIQIDIFPDGQVGGNREMAGLVAEGVIDSALVTIGGMLPRYPLAGVLQMPFVVESTAAARDLYDGPFGQRLTADIEARTGMIVLGFADSGGLQVITNSQRPLRTAEDFKGLKIRSIQGGDVLDSLIRALGAVPVLVSSRDEMRALANGVVDGQMNTPTVLINRRYDLVQGFITQTNHLALPYVWLFNRRTFGSLSPPQQQALRASARQAVAASWAMTLAAEQSGRNQQILGRRMELTFLTPQQREALRAITQPKVREAILKSLGDEGRLWLEAFLTAGGGDCQANGGRQGRCSTSRAN